MNKLTKLDKLSGIFTYVVFFFAFWYVTWTFTNDGNIIQSLKDQWYFTNQSNIIVLVTVTLYWARYDNKKWFRYLASIALVNIFITSTGFHFILAPETIDYYGHLSHTINPILYILWYFIVVRDIVPLKLFWINIIYPMTYLLLVLILGTFPLGFYPYGFLDVAENGLANVLQFTLTILFPLYTVVALLMTTLKYQLEQRVFRKFID